MPRTVSCATLALLLLAAVPAKTRSESPPADLLRLLVQKPWIGLVPHHHWNQPRPAEPDLESTLTHGQYLDDEEDGSEVQQGRDDVFRDNTDKRSAVATALNAGRRRRQPTPALGVLNDVGSFFDSLRDNLETLASLSPQQRATLLQDTPTVVQPPSHNGGGGGGGGIRRLHALRPLRPTGNIRSYNRRSFVETEGGYPGANQHDPGLLWTGLGR